MQGPAQPEREAEAGRTGEATFSQAAQPPSRRPAVPAPRSDPASPIGSGASVTAEREEGGSLVTRTDVLSETADYFNKRVQRTTRARSRLRLAFAAALLGLTSAIPAVSADATTSTLRLIVEPNAGIAPIDALLSGAKYSVDLVMYELADPHIEAILATDESRGVAVHVLLDRDYEESHNAAAYDYLTAHRVAVRWASDPGIDLTHEKAAVIDNSKALVMTLNLVTTDYSTTRDFAIIDTNPTDVAAIGRTFTADWDGVPVYPNGADLVWSPGAEAPLVALINGAHHSLLIENEEMADPYITTPLENAARRGVHVQVVMTASSDWDSAFRALSDVGVSIRTYAPSSSLYIHAKAIVADSGYANERVFVGSQNFSITSLVHNRELGIITSSPAIVRGVASTITADYSGGLPWQVAQ